MDLISVIVPVYKTETYLDKCVLSITNQTYTNLEIILVDDGSPDRSGEICDAWAKKDSRIHVIHKNNGGVSSARNMGISLSEGDYICFVDSDDWIAPDFVQLLWHAIKQNHVPVAICRMHKTSRISPVNPTVASADVPVRIISNEEAMTSLVIGGLVQGGACDKMYSRAIVNGAVFPEGRRHEDEFFTHTVINKADKLAFVDTELYFYLQQEDSFMHTVSVAHLDMLDAMMERLGLLQTTYPKLYRKAKAAICVQCVCNCRDALRLPKAASIMYIARIKACRKQLTFQLSDLVSCTPKELVYVLASRIGLVTFSRLLNIRSGE